MVAQSWFRLWITIYTGRVTRSQQVEKAGQCCPATDCYSAVAIMAAMTLVMIRRADCAVAVAVELLHE